uniref:PAS domain-containing protein n=1 Tax=Leptocylindrus danicus TaxID=163516 RepID=A0A7S2NRK4_9STRA
MTSINIATTLIDFLRAAFDFLGKGSPVQGVSLSNARRFNPQKKLCESDSIIIAMLNSNGHEDICYCICDPDKNDMPIIFASDGFCKFTGYEHGEIEGRNCRFLQGESTSAEDVQTIREAIKTHEQKSVNLLNYRKDGSTFVNEFFISPLYSIEEGEKKLAYYIGVQCPVSRQGPGQAPSNVGWVYRQANKEETKTVPQQ